MADNPTPKDESPLPSKAGLRTTEFWATIGASAPLLFKTFESADWKVQIACILAIAAVVVAYILTRGTVKKSS